MSRGRLAAVGAFVLVTLGLFATALFLIGERRLLFTPRIELVTEFANVSGLQPGAPVRVAGMNAGDVREVIVPIEPAGPFRVRFTIREDLQTLVRTDSVASIQTEGIVGGTFLAVAAGTRAAPPAPPGSRIPSREPIEFADLLQQMVSTVALINESIVEVRDELEVALRAVSETAERANDIIEEIGDDVTAMAGSGRRIADSAAAVLADIEAGQGTIGQLLKDDEMYRQATEILEQTRQAAIEARAAVQEGREAVATFNRPDGAAQGLIADARQTVIHARGALANLEENTEALKRNWFFRGFFRRRGYFDLDAVTPMEYRDGVLRRGNRHDLRIWLRADLLFEPSPDGIGLRLTPDGRARVDSAMSTLLRYTMDGPLMVEGHAVGASRAEDFITAQHRAATVREYVIWRFDLSPQHVGIMPLVEAVDHGPDGRRWDGVALALFVHRDVVRRAQERLPARPGEAAVGGDAPEGAAEAR